MLLVYISRQFPPQNISCKPIRILRLIYPPQISAVIDFIRNSTNLPKLPRRISRTASFLGGTSLPHSASHLHQPFNLNRPPCVSWLCCHFWVRFNKTDETAYSGTYYGSSISRAEGLVTRTASLYERILKSTI